MEKTTENTDKINDFKKWVDPITGEIREGLLISPEEIQHSIKAFEAKNDKRKYMGAKSELEQSIERLGKKQGFFFYRYNNFLESIDNDFASAFRFLFICSYTNYEGCICKHTSRGRIVPITKEELPNFFECKKQTNTKIVNRLLELDLIRYDGHKVYVNDKYCIRGKLGRASRTEVTRVFVNGIRQLYRSSEAREHKKIGRIIAIFEFMHIDTNVICEDITEPVWDDISPLTMHDVTEILGYERRATNVVQPMLLAPRVNGQGLLGIFYDHGKRVVVVNPYIFYSGSDPEAMKWLMSLFAMEPKEKEEKKPPARRYPSVKDIERIK